MPGFCNIRFKTQKPPPEGYPKELRTVGDHIRKIRLDKGLWQAQAAEAMNVTEACVYNWENNRHKPKIMHWPKIIEFLGYDPEHIKGNTLAIVLQNYRRKHGLKRELLAKKIGVDATTVLWWERGREVKQKRNIRQLQQFLQKEEIQGVDIPLYDTGKRMREVHRRRKIKASQGN